MCFLTIVTVVGCDFMPAAPTMAILLTGGVVDADVMAGGVCNVNAELGIAAAVFVSPCRPLALVAEQHTMTGQR
jgi:hypothetical protein